VVAEGEAAPAWAGLPNAWDDSSANATTVGQVLRVVGKQSLLGKCPSGIAKGHKDQNGCIARGQALQQVAGAKQEVRRVHRMSNDGIRTARHHTTVRGSEAKGSPKRQDGAHRYGDAGQLQNDPGPNSPHWMCAFWPEEDAAKRSGECEQPVIRAARHESSGSSNQIGDGHERLLGEEDDPDQTV
jgi:hypothetical protein